MNDFPYGRAIFVVPTAVNDPVTEVALGLVHLFREAGHSAGYIKPIAETGMGALMLGEDLAPYVDDPAPAPMAVRDVETMIRSGRTSDLMDKLVEKIATARQGREVMVIEGLHPSSAHPLFYDLDRIFGGGLSADVMPFVNGALGNVEDVIGRVADAIHAFGGGHGGQPVRVIIGAIDTAARRKELAEGLERVAFSCPCSLVEQSLMGVGAGPTRAGLEHSAAVMGDWFPDLSRVTAPRRLTPPLFRHRLVEMAKAANQRIVLPEGDEIRTIKAASICAEKGIAHCVLLGDPGKIRATAAAEGISLTPSLEILDPDPLRPVYVPPMTVLRASKGMIPAMADEALHDRVVLGTMMLAEGHVDGLVSGAVHTTADTVRPALQLIRTKPGASLVSSVFFMLMPKEVLVYGDCAINPDPTPEQLAEIAIQSADSAATFGIDPRIAMISYSTGSSGHGADVEKVKAATDLVRTLRPDLTVDGPMQYDAATVESVARTKAPDSLVAGRANVFIFPDLNTGNTTYKAVQRSADVVSVGPMLQGLRKPVNDLSRGALVDDIVYTVALTAVQAASPSTPARKVAATAAE